MLIKPKIYQYKKEEEKVECMLDNSISWFFPSAQTRALTGAPAFPATAPSSPA